MTIIELAFDKFLAEEVLLVVVVLDKFVQTNECSADVGIPTKVLVPPGAKRGPYENKFADNLHITAMVALNAAGDAIPPYLILPLKYLPRNVAPMVARNQLNVSGSEKRLYDR